MMDGSGRRGSILSTVSSQQVPPEDDEAALVDSFFLPGGILDPIDDGNDEEERQQGKQDAAGGLDTSMQQQQQQLRAPQLQPHPHHFTADDGDDGEPLAAANQPNSFWTNSSSTSAVAPSEAPPGLQKLLLEELHNSNNNKKDDLHFEAPSLFAFHESFHASSHHNMSSNDHRESTMTRRSSIGNESENSHQLSASHRLNMATMSNKLPPLVESLAGVGIPQTPLTHTLTGAAAPSGLPPMATAQEEDVRQMVLALSSSLQNIGDDPNHPSAHHQHLQHHLPDHLLQPDSPPKIIRHAHHHNHTHHHPHGTSSNTAADVQLLLEFPESLFEEERHIGDHQSATSSLSSGSADPQLDDDLCSPIPPTTLLFPTLEDYPQQLQQQLLPLAATASSTMPFASDLPQEQNQLLSSQDMNFGGFPNTTSHAKFIPPPPGFQTLVPAIETTEEPQSHHHHQHHQHKQQTDTAGKAISSMEQIYTMDHDDSPQKQKQMPNVRPPPGLASGPSSAVTDIERNVRSGEGFDVDHPKKSASKTVTTTVEDGSNKHPCDEPVESANGKSHTTSDGPITIPSSLKHPPKTQQKQQKQKHDESLQSPPSQPPSLQKQTSPHSRIKQSQQQHHREEQHEKEDSKELKATIATKSGKNQSQKAGRRDIHSASVPRNHKQKLRQNSPPATTRKSQLSSNNHSTTRSSSTFPFPYLLYLEKLLDCVEVCWNVSQFCFMLLFSMIYQALKEALEEKTVTLCYAILYFVPIYTDKYLDRTYKFPHYFAGIATSMTLALVCLPTSFWKQENENEDGNNTSAAAARDNKNGSATNHSVKKCGTHNLPDSSSNSNAHNHHTNPALSTTTTSGAETQLPSTTTDMETKVCNFLASHLHWQLPLVVLVLSFLFPTTQKIVTLAPMNLVVAFGITMLKTHNLFSPLAWLSASVQVCMVMPIRKNPTGGTLSYIAKWRGTEVLVAALGLATLRFLRLQRKKGLPVESDDTVVTARRKKV